jgi:hypothetical protein
MLGVTSAVEIFDPFWAASAQILVPRESQGDAWLSDYLVSSK